MAREVESSAFVSGRQLATYLEVTPEYVRQLVVKGMPQEGRDKYDILLATRWYVRMLREAAKRRTQPGDVGGADALRKQRATLIDLQAQTQGLELSRMRGELVPVETAEAWFREFVLALKTKLLGATPKLSQRLLGIKTRAQAREVADEMMREALRAAMTARETFRPSENGKNGHASP